MAITSITIENFKGIGDAVTIPIRPISLLFGKNSSGKSTVLQALLYMAHVIRYGDPDPLHLMNKDIDFMNLGGFHSFVHLHELDRNIVIRIEFEVEKVNGWAKIKTGWNMKKDCAYIASRTIGVGDEKWEYDDVPARMNHLKTGFIEELKGIRSLAPIRKVPSRDPREFGYGLELSDDEFKVRNGSHWNGLEAWAILLRDGLLGDHQLIDKVNGQMEDLALGCEIVCRESYVVSLGVDELEKKLRAFCVSKDGDSQDQISDLLKQLPRPRRTFQFYLLDKNRGCIVEVLDFGSGISQVIPVLVGVLEDSYRLFAVAQPELHVHPAVQVGLGDLFIDAIKNSNRTMLVETHSEHLLLRLLRRVRETTEGEQTDHTLTPDDLSVVYVRPTPEGIKFTPISVTDDGDFYAPWPEGFFDERVKELF